MSGRLRARRDGPVREVGHPTQSWQTILPWNRECEKRTLRRSFAARASDAGKPFYVALLAPSSRRLLGFPDDNVTVQPAACLQEGLARLDGLHWQS